METVLIAIERDKFNYLYKYNHCVVSPLNIVDTNYEALGSAPVSIASQLEQSLPVYEAEFEVFFLEYDKAKIIQQNGVVSLDFSGAIKAIPLNNEAYELLQSRLNSKLNIEQEIPAEIYKEVHWLREHKTREAALQKVMSIFQIDITQLLKGDLYQQLQTNVRAILQSEPTNELEQSPFYQLLTFDITPSFIPEGNIESFLKLGCVGLKAMGRDITLLPKGVVFQVLMHHRELINSKGLLESYQAFEQIYQQATKDEQAKVDALNNVLNKDFPTLNTFLIFYLYLSFNRLSQKEDNSLVALTSIIQGFKKQHPQELMHALAIFAYIHSFGRLYESIHLLEKAPMFDSNHLTNKPLEMKGNEQPNNLSNVADIHAFLSRKLTSKDKNFLKIFKMRTQAFDRVDLQILDKVLEHSDFKKQGGVLRKGAERIKDLVIEYLSLSQEVL